MTGPSERSEFAADVSHYLSQSPRQLPSRYLYDDLGSALFEAICMLPWYQVTRTEQRLLRAHARAILARMSPLTRLVELGPGHGTKMATLLEAASGPVTAHLIDISPAALRSATRTLGVFPDVSVVTHAAQYAAGLDDAMRAGTAEGRTLALFLGSNIGNFDPPGAHALLEAMRGALSPGDALLIGTDLVKPERDLILAYDDPLGVTAAFNRNILVRANRELGADFALDAFAHRAVWNADASRIEMHLVSRGAQRVCVPSSGIDIAFDAGEAIWTESSYKYRVDTVNAMLARARLNTVEQWVDSAYALTLAEAR
jgi:L-histidine Nalpha-methyltransferase